MSRQFDEYWDSIPRDIPGKYFTQHYGVTYEALDGSMNYYIGNDGTLISCLNGTPHVMATWENAHGHQYSRIKVGKKSVTVLIHRLVAEHFVPNPHNYPVVRHLDDDPRYNYYRNLAWGTQKDNMRDMFANGGAYTKKVVCVETEEVFNSCADLARKLGVCPASVTMTCKGKLKSLKGKHYRYLDDR